MTLFRQSSLAVFAALVLTGSRFALTAILARRLLPASFGQFIYVQWLVDIAFLVCSLGATAAIGRYVAEYRNDAVQLSALIEKWRPWALGLPMLAGGTVLIGIWISGLTLNLTAMVFVAAWAIASGAWAMQTAALTGLQRFDLIFVANLIASVTLMTGALVLPISNESPVVLFGLMTVAAGLAVLPGFSETNRFRSSARVPIGVDLWRAIRRYAMNMWLVALLWALLWSRGELPVIRLFWGDAGVAGYAAALTLFGGAMQGVMLGVSAVAPELTHLWGNARRDDAFALARSVMDIQLLVCGIAAVVLICLGPELLSFVFGASYRGQASTLAILSFGLISMALSNQNHLLQIATDGRFSRNSSLVGLAILGTLAFALIPTLGPDGAALTRAATMTILLLFSIIETKRVLRDPIMPLINLASVFTIVSVCLCFVSNSYFSSMIARSCILLVSLILIVIAVRTQERQLKASAIILSLNRKMRVWINRIIQLRFRRP